jgi:hypothetical protein
MVDGSGNAEISGAACDRQNCVSDNSGYLHFTYGGGYSTHTFSIVRDTTPPASFSLLSPADNFLGDANSSFSWQASGDSETGLSHYRLYIDGALDTDNISGTTQTPSGPPACGNHTWHVRAFDYAGNSTDSDIYDFTLLCGNGLPIPPQSQQESEKSEANNESKDEQNASKEKEPVISHKPDIFHEEAGLFTEKAETPISPDMEKVQSKKAAGFLKSIVGLLDKVKDSLYRYIVRGTQSTEKIGEDERTGTVNSFKAAFGRWPEGQADWSDIIKIANGRWPGQINEEAEKNATITFEKVYLRKPDRKNQYDDAAVTIIAYGLRHGNRNLKKEAQAIRIFRDIYGHMPQSAGNWDIVRAIAYSGAKR